MISRKINDSGIELIKHYEGFSATPYKCSGGFTTIGYGHKLKENERFEHVTEKEAEEMLHKDIEAAEMGVCRYIRSDITDNQFSSLVSFTYNLGAGALQRSTLRQKINYDSCPEEICEEFLKWVFAGGKKIKGLYKRRYDEAVMFYNG